MATSYTSLLGLALPVQGELTGSWGNVVNDSITSLLDSAVAGTTTLSTDADVTLTTTTGASNQARQAILACTGARTAQRTITAPAASKAYIVVNDTTGGYAVKVVGVGPTTGVTIAAGERCIIAWNGTDFVKVAVQSGAGAFTTLSASGQITSTVSTGTAPLVIASTTKVSNLNADLLDGTDWTAPGPIGGTTPGSGAFTTVSATGQITSTVSTGTAPLVIASTTKVTNLNADRLDGTDWTAPGPIGGTTPSSGAFTTVSATGQITSTVSTGTAPLVIASTTKVSNLNADLLDGTDWTAPGPIGGTTPGSGAFTTLSASSPSSITVNSSSAALTITQDGTGNALVVNDVSGDTTPFVVDANGRVAVGATTAYIPVSGLAAGVGVHSTGSQSNELSAFRWSTDALQPFITLSKSRGATPGTQGLVSNGDAIGTVVWTASDGTNFVQAARIEAAVDGTPGTNDMPGRLVFSTTADGASSPTERMRIDNAGNVGIGTASNSAVGIEVGKSITGATTAYGIRSLQTVQSDVTTTAYAFISNPSTAAASFTMSGGLQHFAAFQGTIGAGSTVTNQYGFHATSTLTGATNNYGFYGNIPAGTGRYNLYMAGTADSYLAGALGIGSADLSRFAIHIGKNITGNATSYGILNDAAIQSDVTTNAFYNRTGASTAAASFTLAGLTHYDATQNTIGAGSTVTSQYGFRVQSSLTGATNNYGFYGDIAAGTNRYNLYMNGTADNYLAGALGIGSTAGAGQSLRVIKNVTGATNAFNVVTEGFVQSDVTTAAYGVYSAMNTAAAAFTLTDYRHFQAAQGTIGAGSTVTNQYGFVAASGLTGATNNYGFYGNIAAGSNRWNLFMNGTANNYLGGALGIGDTVLTGYNIKVSRNLTGSTDTVSMQTLSTIQSDSTNSSVIFGSKPSTAAASFTLSNLFHFVAELATLGAGSAITNQYGFYAQSSLTGATNNFGFYGNIAAGTGRYNLYMNGTADNYLAGSLGVGGLPTTAWKVTVAGSVSGAATANQYIAFGTFQSDVTSNGRGFITALSTQATAFTMTNMAHYLASQATIGAGSTVTNQFGFQVANSLTGATNNYGFYGDIAAGTNRWNLYMNGTADNYLNGTLLVGTTTNTNSSKVVASGTISETVSSTQYLVASAYDVGTGASQIPTNSMLGSMAFANLPTVSAPATASSTGTAGQIAFDSSYFYVCVAANTWKRVAVATF